MDENLTPEQDISFEINQVMEFRVYADELSIKQIIEGLRTLLSKDTGANYIIATGDKRLEFIKC